MKKLTYILIISILIFSCDDKNCYIKDVYVKEFVNLSDDNLIAIAGNGSSIFVEGGVEGIIIYHEVGDSYKAYDRNCSYEPCLPCSYIDTVIGGIAYCNCCPSAFSLSNGESFNAPALLPLKEYYCKLNNNILEIKSFD